MSEELAEADHNLAEIARLRRQLALAEAEIATLRAAHAAARRMRGARRGCGERCEGISARHRFRAAAARWWLV